MDKSNPKLNLTGTNDPPQTIGKKPPSLGVTNPNSLSVSNSLDVSNKKVTTTSATGNPRNKCALKPGHSLMDWIRLGSSGLDLSGPDELMKGIGKDATKLFEDVHAWVNYEQLLGKCYVGPLRNSAIIDLEPLKPLTKTSSDNSGSFRLPVLPFLQTSSAKTSPTKSANTSKEYNVKTGENAEVVPRFDWIQKTSDLTLIFYTRPLCNPGLVITHKSSNQLEVRIQIERTTHVYSVELSHDVNYPCAMKVSYETGKIELRFVKTQPQLWTNYGVLEKQKLTEFEGLQLEYEILKRETITHDSYAVILQPVKKVLLFNPIGFHISVTSNVNGVDVTRSYTPVPIQYCPVDVTAPTLPLLIKSYELGILSKHITSADCSPVRISQSKGSFMLTSLKEHTNIGLLAAGSGITPILSVLQYLLERTSNKVEKVQLLLFNKTEQDIWCRKILEKTAEKDARLTIRHILSEPQGDWQGEVGRVTQELIAPLADPKSQSYVTFCCICGPNPFNDLSEKLLKGSGFPAERLHFFQG
ncbi:unnamed protein product [Hermetia illucens]|uniref:Cytochrome-b5 reductase n=1 Tax=Hermetia illucens TaxID=343691 RepID=A0A7R8UWN6_HERIL|nr:unnamed protein product [Hermetia illucens]